MRAIIQRAFRRDRMNKLTSDFKEMQGKVGGGKKRESAALSVWGHKTGAQSNKSDH